MMLGEQREPARIGDGGAQRRADRSARRLSTPRMATALSVATLLLIALDVPLESAIGTLNGAQALILVFVLPFTVVGLIVSRRAPGNPLGWLLLAIPLVEVIVNDASDYAVFAYHFGHRGSPLAPVAVLLDYGLVPGLILIPLVVLLFPDGQLERRWRMLVRLFLVLIVAQLTGLVFVAAVALGHHFPVDGSGTLFANAHPVGAAAWFGIARRVTAPLFAVFCVLVVARQIVSYRRSSGVRRQQLKWLGSGATICIAALVATAAGALKSAPAILWILVIVAWTALPISIGVGILRYRLYEIDRLISRTLSYALLSGLLVGTFIGLIALTTDVLSLSGRVGVAASTLAAAALLAPLRRRVQRLVDRRFNRARYDAEQLVAAFSGRLRDAVELDTIRRELIDVVNGAVAPAHASLWIKRLAADGSGASDAATATSRGARAQRRTPASAA